MKYSIQKITKIIAAQVLSDSLFESEIHHISFDSRRVDFPKHTLFFAFKSSRNDGHQFIEELYQKGVRNFVISNKIEINQYASANFLVVKNPLQALQQLALHHRQQFLLPSIGITGSNGKTIIKEWLFQLLHEDYNIVRSPLSFNSQIGVPISVLQIEKEHNLGIFEAGISKTEEMKNLQAIINCSLGIFTNIGEAHNEGFQNQKEKIQEKLILFKNTENIIYCRDHTAIDAALKVYTDKKLTNWSRSQSADLQITKEEKTNPTSNRIYGIYKGRSLSIDIPFSDLASVENAIHCWLVLLELDLDDTTIQERFSRINSIAMRLELKSGINESILINDSYSSDLTSLSIALNFLEQQSGEYARTVILSDIFQSGKKSEKLYQEVASLLKDKKISKVIGIGDSIKTLSHFYKSGAIHFYKNTNDFLDQYQAIDFQKEIILLKGARNFQFENIANRLAKKSHNTSLEINLNALTHNLNIFKQSLNPKTKLMVMIKAAAYGSGSDEVGRLLQFQKVDYLAVAYADEGVELRKAGIKLPIMVLNPEKATFDTLLRYQLEPEIYSINLLQQFIRFLPEGHSPSIHLKLDTGMHRLGFEPQDLPTLIKLLKQNPKVKVQSIFSHLAASDEQIHDGFTEAQYKHFETMAQQIISQLAYKPLLHILNSSGIIRFPQYQLDMVRLGIGLYGIDVNQVLQEQLHTVLTLKASISQIKIVSKNETIGYGRKGKVRSETRIATVSIGYADGLLRKAGNGRYSVLIHGKKAPIIGNVCMDMTMVNISEIPEAEEGDEVIIFGKDHPVEILANSYDSLVYEVFTSISERVKRVYFQD